MVKVIFDAAVHAERVESVASGATRAMPAARAAIHAIAAAHAEVAEFKVSLGAKQVNRYLSNQGIDVEALTPAWIRYVLDSRREALIALDWTESDAGDHVTLCAYLVTTHGRATPLCWQTLRKSSLGNGLRAETEVALIERLARAIPPEVAITLLADRGFGNQRLFHMFNLPMLDRLGWHYVIRFHGNIPVTHAGESRPAREWLPASGRATRLAGAQVTDERLPVGAVVLVQVRQMKERWCLVTSLAEQPASAIVKLYGRRFTIEDSSREQNDLRFGLGLRETRVRKEARRDRLLMLLALSRALLTLLGAASERSGLDAYLKANTVKHRTHSLFRQGTEWFECLPTMEDDWLERLMAAYAEVLAEQAGLRDILDAI